jgi:hypothetical protein
MAWIPLPQIGLANEAIHAARGYVGNIYERFHLLNLGLYFANVDRNEKDLNLMLAQIAKLLIAPDIQ